DHDMEWAYRRLLVENGAGMDVLSFGEWSATEPVPRKEIESGQHAGLITTPNVVNLLPGPRERQMVASDMVRCHEPRRVHVTAEGILALGTADFRFNAKFEGWQKLAHMPVCDSCHARIDYGTQFLLAWDAGFHFDSRLGRHDKEKLFIRDQHDL